MNRQRLAAILVALAGSVGGGVAVVTGVLSPGAPLVVRVDASGAALLEAVPDPSQCPTLLAGGGDRPYEVRPDGLDDRAEDTVARVLQSLASESAISGAHTEPVDGGCHVCVYLTPEQASSWREVLTGLGPDGTVGDAVATLTPVPTSSPTVCGTLAGWSEPAAFSTASDLAAKE